MGKPCCTVLYLYDRPDLKLIRYRLIRLEKIERKIGL